MFIYSQPFISSQCSLKSHLIFPELYLFHTFVKGGKPGRGGGDMRRVDFLQARRPESTCGRPKIHMTTGFWSDCSMEYCGFFFLFLLAGYTVLQKKYPGGRPQLLVDDQFFNLNRPLSARF